MVLDQKEGIVEHFIFNTECIGTEKTNTDIMITILKEGEEFDYFDLFLSKEKAIELRDQLDVFLKSEL